jgi:hypothetical protein
MAGFEQLARDVCHVDVLSTAIDSTSKCERRSVFTDKSDFHRYLPQCGEWRTLSEVGFPGQAVRICPVAAYRGPQHAVCQTATERTRDNVNAFAATT